MRHLILALLVALMACSRPEPPDAVLPPMELEPVVERLSEFIRNEMTGKDLPALSIALVDGARTVWAAGFGEARPDLPATANTIYRVGSVSKLFTDLAVMQLVERGALDLDAPITEYLPDFRIGEFLSGDAVAAPPPTLRQLMSHRAGIVREPPVGNYFDASNPPLSRTVASLNGTPRIYAPGTRVKYSNAGIATVGYVLERTQEVPFTDYVQRQVLEPLGMHSSSFVPTEDTAERLADAVMWSYDGREFPAPTFQLGMAPAGSMYAPVTDLGAFMGAVFTASPALGVSEAGLNEMLSPQFGSGFGLGFSLGSLDGHRYAGHGGAIYGFATQLAMLPDEHLGAVAVTTRDVSNTVTSRVTEYALRLMLAAREGLPLPNPVTTQAVPRPLARKAQGRYADGAGLELTVVARPGGDTWMELGRERYLLGTLSDTLVIDDRHGFGGFFQLDDNDLVARDGTRFEKTSTWPGPRPASPDTTLLEYVGEYGWTHNVLFIYEKAGALHALIEWTEMDPLTRIDRDTFAFPASGGLYHGERIVFQRNQSGEITAAVAAGVRFPRRRGADAGETFTITPLRPVEELRPEALSASPPNENGDFLETDLVELSDLDDGILYDIRYASTNNFMQSVFYQEPHAFLQRPAAEAVARAHKKLEELGFGLLIHDAYRPWFVTKMFWDATPDQMKTFVANPANGSRHNRGAAVDLTLYDLETGEPVVMPSGYDEFSARAYAEYVGGTSEQRWLREVLRSAMEAEGFRVYEFEWWHFDYKDWRRYPILNKTFEDLDP